MTYQASEPKRQRCTAHKTNGSGDQCKNWAMHGGRVCQAHGGRAPQVKNRARQRLDDMVDPALGRLRRLIDARNDGVALQAVKDILDRTGHKLPERIEADNAVTIRVEYEAIPIQAIDGALEEVHTNGTAQTNGH